MEKLFLSVLNINITASYVILFVMVVRLLLKKVPKLFSYALWSIVLIRLVCPFSLTGIFSLIPISTSTVPHDIMYQQSPQVDSGIRLLDSAINNVLPVPVPGASMNPLQLWITLGAVVWIIGLAVLLLYSIVTWVRLALRLKAAVPMGSNIYEMNGIKSPFVFGFFRPNIYLPQSLFPKERDYILAHEQTHIKRLDHIIKPFAFLVLCVHWFNPLVWAAFFLMGEDMEFSCDESVIKQLGSDIKQDYSISLLSLSTGRRIVGGCPLAFGENNTKGRIMNVLHYKRPAFWVIIIAAVSLVAVAIGLLGSSRTDNALTSKGETTTSEQEAINQIFNQGVIANNNEIVYDTRIEVLSYQPETIDGKEYYRVDIVTGETPSAKLHGPYYVAAKNSKIFVKDSSQKLVPYVAVGIGLTEKPNNTVSPIPQEPFSNDTNSIAGDKMTDAEIFELANRLMLEGEEVFWWYHSDHSDYLEVALDSEPLVVNGQYWQRVGKYKTMAQLKAATESVFTLDFCKEHFYVAIARSEKFREFGGVLYNSHFGGMGWGYGFPKRYVVQSSEQDKIVLTAVCDGINSNNTPQDTIEYEFNLTMLRDSSGWKLDDYYNFTSAGFIGDLQPNTTTNGSTASEPSSGPWVDKAFPVPTMDAEQQMYNDTYIRPILLTGLLWENWGKGDYAAISPDPVNNPQADYLILAFEDITGIEKMKELFSTYNFNFPAGVVEDVLLARFPFTADQLHEILTFYYRPEEKTYYYEGGRGGGPIDCAVTKVMDSGNGTVVLEYVTLVGYYYEEGTTSEQEKYLYKKHGTLTLEKSNDGIYRYLSVKPGLEEEAHPS